MDLRYHALAQVLKQDLVYRIWILQDVIFSGEVHIRVGGVCIAWSQFSSFMKLFSDPESYLLVGRDALYVHMADVRHLRKVCLLAHDKPPTDKHLALSHISRCSQRGSCVSDGENNILFEVRRGAIISGELRYRYASLYDA
jgi:hypothetical protein